MEKICERCAYYGKPADAPETAEEQCMYTPDEDEEGEGWTPPCFRDDTEEGSEEG